MKQKVCMFYHAVDMDGWSSIAQMCFFAEYMDIFDPDVNIQIQPWNYGYTFRTSYVKDCEMAFLLDVHLSQDDTQDLIMSLGSGNLVVLDHHASEFEFFNSIKEYLFEDSKFSSDHAACKHVYDFIGKHLRKDAPDKIKKIYKNISLLIDLIDLWDTHTYVNLTENDAITPDEVKYVKYYISSVQSKFDEPSGQQFWFNLFEKALNEEDFFAEINEMMTYGKIIYISIQRMNLDVMPAYSFEAHFEGYNMLCVNTLPGQGSSIYDEYAPAKTYDLLCNFYYNPKRMQWAFSIYKSDFTTKDIDLLNIWKKYDKILSGGHATAGCIRCNSFKYDYTTKKLELLFD